VDATPNDEPNEKRALLMAYPQLRLRPGRDYTLRHGHPWVFSGAFQTIPRGIFPGAVVDVFDADDHWLARGHLNPANSLAFRALSWDEREEIDVAFYVRRFARAAALRALLPDDVTAYRLVHAEADGVPGLIVDRYDCWLVAQFHTAGVERDRALILEALAQAIQPEGILARDDVNARGREGLAVGGAVVVHGDVPETIEIREGAVRYLIDPYHGQKTGFFLDQREKRARIAELSLHATSLLNCFSYSGGFGLAGLAGNPALRTVNVDSSAPALELARRNYGLNGHDPAAHEFVDSDVTRYLQSAADSGERFDIVVLDPPAFAKSLSAKEKALRAYERLNTLGAQVVAPGGLLLTCSCSGGVDAAEFESAVRVALARAGRMAQIITSFGPSLDHPTLPGYVEDRYLKALLLRVL
jgi:23S rRNA (cytosine1962-C5)-methyltransferase